MIVTNRSVYIADYCISSIIKVSDILSKDYQVIFKIYLNCINQEKYGKYIAKWEKNKYTEICFSELTPEDFTFTNGIYKAKNGKEYIYPMEFEEPFDKTYKATKANYFISVDSDLEVLNPILVIDMLNYMEAHPDLPIFSTDRTETRKYFDFYSKDEIILHERNDTWFLIFNNNYKVNDISCHPVDFYIKPNGEKIFFQFGKDKWTEYIKNCKKQNGQRQVYDGTAWLQQEIRSNYPFETISIKDIHPKYDNLYIHYGAFSQNNSINSPFKIKIYRHLTIRKKIGFVFFPNSLNKIIKIIFRILSDIYFKKSNEERKEQMAQSSLD
jgi:NADPH-dependent 7-cyano-7-deazaguanine reductase QueF-like protein